MITIEFYSSQRSANSQHCHPPRPKSGESEIELHSTQTRIKNAYTNTTPRTWECSRGHTTTRVDILFVG